MGMLGSYADMMNLPRPVSWRHARMPMEKRAAQFSMFKAVAGYEEEIYEVTRVTDKRIELGEDARIMLNAKLQMVADNMAKHPAVSVTYFVPDKTKEGGEYVTVTGVVDRIDRHRRRIAMRAGEMIPIGEIVDIDGDMFLCMVS